MKKSLDVSTSELPATSSPSDDSSGCRLPRKLGSIALRDWQYGCLPTLLNAVDNHGAAIDSSDMGTGKSYTAAFVGYLKATLVGKMIVVVGPLAVLPSWVSIFTGMGLTENKDFVTVVNYESLRSAKGRKGVGGWTEVFDRGRAKKKFVWNKERVGLVVFDEAHKVRAQDITLNAKLPIGAKTQGIPCLFLSATLAESPAHFRAIGFCLGLHNGTGFHKWALAHGCTYDAWGKLVLKKGRAKEVSKQLNALLFPEYGVRVRKADVPGFPEEELLAEAFDFGSNAEIEKVYEEMEAELEALEEKVAADSKRVKEAAKPMVAIIRARQKVELLKVPGVVGMVEDAVAEGQAVVVFANYRETVFQLVERLKKHHPAVVVGEQKPWERQRHIERFQADETHVAVVSIDSGGAGIGFHDLHGDYPRLGFLFPSYSAVGLRQSSGRLPRVGALTKVTQKFLYAAGTVEEKVMLNVRAKLANLDLINDGDLAETLSGVPTAEEISETPQPEDPAFANGFYD